MNRSLPSAPKRGFTLTELAIVLGVVGLVLGGIWAAMSVVMQRVKINDEIQAMKLISDNIRATYSATQNLPCGTQTPCTTSISDVTAAMVTASVFPSNMLVGGSPQTAEGTSITIYVIPDSPSPSNQQFKVTFGATLQNCQALLAYFAGAASDLNVAYVYDDANGWQNPAGNALDVNSFKGCTYAAITFNLH